MNELQKEKIAQSYDKDPRFFSCFYCKKALGTEDCHGCPIYGWEFSEE